MTARSAQAPMSAVLPNLRCERKFTAADSPQSILALVRRHPSLFREAYPPRTVHSLYFDTPELHDYRAHVHGIAARSKTRIRWYGDAPGGPRRPVLERKLKRGLVSGKEGYPLPALPLQDALPRDQLAAALREAELPEELRWNLGALRPVLVSAYHRRYLESADGLLRLTVDSALRFRDARQSNGRWSANSSPVPAVILELKYSPEHASAAAAATQRLPFRLTRFSKYVLGVDRLPTM